jgi:PPK2 family polyphosphate:nucleotide phosphotransferase
MAETGLDRQRIRQLTERLRVKPGSVVKLPKDLDPAFTGGLGHERAEEAQAMLAQGVELLAEYQDRLAAQEMHAVLVILQGMDGAGKDSTIKHVMSGINPQGCQVFSFKQPSTEELSHDFLWRHSQRLPERGRIGIFNRSYYEEVLVVRVHPQVLDQQKLPASCLGKRIWIERLSDIAHFEEYLTRQGTIVLKFFLHLSRGEQRKRFLERLDKPQKNWKFSMADMRERGYWSDYSHAYEEAIRATASKHAPWFVVPADNKWFARLVVAAAIVEALEELKLTYPRVSPEKRLQLQGIRTALARER